MRIKVGFPTPSESPGRLEFLWARPLEDGNYEVDSIPLLVFGIASGDVVATAVSELDGMIFSRVVRPGGHSTYRVMATETADLQQFDDYLSKLKLLGCSFERASKRFIAIDVPPATDVYRAYGLLEEGQTAGIWLFEEGHCGHPLHR